MTTAKKLHTPEVRARARIRIENQLISGLSVFVCKVIFKVDAINEGEIHNSRFMLTLVTE